MTGRRKNQDDQGRTCPDTVDQVRSPLAIHVDYELYEHYLDDPSLSEDQKREFLQALWTIICEFVALGFGVHPAQQAQESCGQLPNIGRKAPESAPIAVDCKDQSIIKSFVEAADL